ncbi:MAG: hypothetical protein P8J25_05390 [Porticoccaceae bacterium]|nr:hypothetical protein [Porticoccaceae bacterium]
MPETDQLVLESNILSSSLLVGLFNQITDDKTLVVLDMGLASSASVSFFGQTKCRLQFAGLIDSEIEKYNDQELSHAERVSLFKNDLNLQPDIKIDIVLFWDLFCYLSAPAIGAVLDALVPNLHSRTKAHSIGLLNARQKMFYSAYGIKSIDQLWQQPLSSTQPKVYPHSRHDFSRILNYLTIDRSCLLSGNRVENLLMINTHKE